MIVRARERGAPPEPALPANGGRRRRALTSRCLCSEISEASATALTVGCLAVSHLQRHHVSELRPTGPASATALGLMRAVRCGPPTAAMAEPWPCLLQHTALAPCPQWKCARLLAQNSSTFRMLHARTQAVLSFHRPHRTNNASAAGPCKQSQASCMEAVPKPRQICR